jgi:hypothetical protein
LGELPVIALRLLLSFSTFYLSIPSAARNWCAISAFSSGGTTLLGLGLTPLVNANLT